MKVNIRSIALSKKQYLSNYKKIVNFCKFDQRNNLEWGCITFSPIKGVIREKMEILCIWGNKIFVKVDKNGCLVAGLKFSMNQILKIISK